MLFVGERRRSRRRSSAIRVRDVLAAGVLRRSRRDDSRSELIL